MITEADTQRLSKLLDLDFKFPFRHSQESNIIFSKDNNSYISLEKDSYYFHLYYEKLEFVSFQFYCKTLKSEDILEALKKQTEDSLKEAQTKHDKRMALYHRFKGN